MKRRRRKKRRSKRIKRRSNNSLRIKYKFTKKLNIATDPKPLKKQKKIKMYKKAKDGP